MSRRSATAALAAANAVAEVQMGCDDVAAWEDSPYRWLRELSSRRRGKAGEILVAQWLDGLGLDAVRGHAGEADMRVGSHLVEVKTSTLWSSGEFVFSQLRDQAYDHVALVGIRPHGVCFWFIPKDVVREHAVGQHGGAGALETRWLRIDAANPPAWMKPYGGTVAAAARVARTLFA